MTNKTTISALICGAWAAMAPHANAQVIPPSISPGAVQSGERAQREEQRREELIQQAPQAPAVTTPATPAASAASEVKNIRVERFQVDSSQILSASEIDSVLAPLRGQTVSLADLQAAVVQINKLYDARRALTARAFLPPQTVRDGVVQIRLVESRTGRLQVQGNQSLASDYVSERLTLSQDSLMSIPTLEEDIARFNRLNATQLRASVVAGEKFGTTDVQITVIEPPRNQFQFYVDNAGRDTTGNARAGFSARSNNLAGLSDSAIFNGTVTEGSHSFGLSYSLPVTRNDLRLDLSASTGEIRIIDGPFQPLDITGKSQDATIGLTQPLLTKLDRSWSTYARFSARESVSRFGGVEQLNEDLRILTFGLAGDRLGDRSSWYLDQFVSVGLTGLGGESDFLYYRMAGNRLDRVSDSFQLVTRASLQLSDTELLPSSELFQVGGAYTVRGFSEGLLSGRNGYYVSAELRYGQGTQAYFESGADAPRVQWLGFIDHGAAFPYRPGILKEVGSNDFLTGVGAGVMFDWKTFSGRLVLAAPLDKNPAELHYAPWRAHAYFSITLP